MATIAGYAVAYLKHDPEKACPGLDPGWAPVFGKDHASSISRRGGIAPRDESRHAIVLAAPVNERAAVRRRHRAAGRHHQRVAGRDIPFGRRRKARIEV